LIAYISANIGATNKLPSAGPLHFNQRRGFGPHQDAIDIFNDPQGTPSQMYSRDITDIQINSLLRLTMVVDHGVNFSEVIIDTQTKLRVVPFLSQFSNTLERVHFGGKNDAGEDIQGFTPVDLIFEEAFIHRQPFRCFRLWGIFQKARLKTMVEKSCSSLKSGS
jgi:hypothetical protein